MVDRMLTRCETTVAEPLLILLRRFATELAREEARMLCDELMAEEDAKVVTLSGNYSDLALILLDEALAAGTFQIAAELGRLFGGSERADHGAVIDPLVAEIGALDDRRTGPQRGRKLVLQRAVGGPRVGLVLLRGDLNQIIAAG